VVFGSSYMLLGERLSAIQLLGSALVIAGIIIAQSTGTKMPISHKKDLL